MSIGVLAYVFWPSSKKRFDKAKDILDKDDTPWT
nr:cbb3-type cytochrome c oxidase subunit 3 [Aurantimonas marina]